VHALNNAGINSTDISLIANRPDDLYPGDQDAVGKDAVRGAEVGAALGGGSGLLAGLGLITIPGLGPVLAGGWIVATVMGALAGAGVGAAAGGIIGRLTDAGIPKSDAHVYAEGIKRGGALVTARLTEAQNELAMQLLSGTGAIDVAARRRDYETEGWRADEQREATPADPLVVDRDRTPTVPPFV
jgi:hypothetical protein